LSTKITISFCVPTGHQPGDYARLHGDNGSGVIGWDAPLDNTVYDLFPNGSGIYGWGYAPWGEFPWGRPFSVRTSGWSYQPWGYSPWGYGAAVVVATYVVDSCGTYKFGFACYDSLGNLHEGVPEEISVIVHTAPPAPTGLKKISYDPDTDVLVLEAL
jgi:hypothetical protein